MTDISTTQPLTYPYDAPPEEGHVREIAPGILWIRMPLELTGLNHINLWALRDGEGWTIVDTGMKTDLIMSNWERILKEELQGLPVVRVICTHFHPDHMGLAGWLCERFNAPLWTSLGEWNFGRMIYLNGRAQGRPASALEHFKRVGFGAEVLQALTHIGPSHYADAVYEIPFGFKRIRDGQDVVIGGYSWRAISGEGHSPEHICLYCGELGLMISGDQILPKITPHIGVYPEEPEGNKLQEYMDSLPRFKELPNDTLLLPAHGLPFRGVRQRVDYLIQHHVLRLDRLEAALEEPTRIMSTLKVLFQRQLSPTEVFLGSAECLAHLNCLVERGSVVRSIGDDGVWRFQRIDADSAAA